MELDVQFWKNFTWPIMLLNDFFFSMFWPSIGTPKNTYIVPEKKKERKKEDKRPGTYLKTNKEQSIKHQRGTQQETLKQQKGGKAS